MRLIILLLFMFNICLLHGQLKDSTVRKYFVCESKWGGLRPQMIEDGHRIWVRDSSGNKLRGKLKILSDTAIEVHHLATGIKDTFSIKSLSLVRKPTIAGTLGSGIALFVGVGATIGGVVMFIELYDYVFFQVLGGIFVAGGIGYGAIGLATMNGPRYHNHDFKYRIIQTKGFKLKKRYIKHL
jgi:hypothetical protein